MTTPWYAYPRVDNYAVFPDPFGAFPKPDSNINAPPGTPITALSSGVVSGINAPGGGLMPAFGQVVTIKLDNAYNSIATHAAYLHLNGVASNLAVGQHVNVGDTIGYAGPNAQGNAATGFAFYNGDYYGYGSSWARFVGSAALNPVPFLNSLPAGGGSSQLASGIIGANSLTGDVASSLLDPIINPIESNISSSLSAGMLLVVAIIAIVGGLVLLIANTPLGEGIKSTATHAVEVAAMA